MSSLPPLEILFFPFPSPGHYLPLLDIAAIIASRGAKATVVVNPAILSRLSPSILRTSNLHFHSIPFPSAAAGLPDEISTADAVPANLSHRFAFAISLLREPFTELLHRLSPSAVISDSLLPFTAETAASLNIPWFSFPGTGLFALSIDFSLFKNKFISDSFSVPGLPDRIELTHSQLKETTLPGKLTKEFFALAKKAEDFASGVIVNSFTELEPGYAEHYQREMKKPVFLIGPVSAIRCGEEEEENDSRIMNWLKKKEERSVVYVCFGSLCHLPKNQILEIGRGLEDSGVAFIWVIREAPASPEVAEEVKEIEERVGDRGMIVRGWITGQASLLRHKSIGGFLTHCGWGAVTEAAAAGIPMLTWPMFGEQFYNEKLVNEVVGIGVEIGVKEGFVWGEEEKIGVLVGRERISERVRLLMADSSTGNYEEMEEVKKRVKGMKEKAMKAIEEGGSSYKAVESLLEHIRMFR